MKRFYFKSYLTSPTDKQVSVDIKNKVFKPFHSLYPSGCCRLLRDIPEAHYLPDEGYVVVYRKGNTKERYFFNVRKIKEENKM
ncbi:hypothetical protein A4G19_03630 [Pasteurellaceae bacterium Macca]|nr:hypothetical protein [Pasteurellaceae bacterium Macca]